MPTIAKTSQAKRLLSDFLHVDPDGEENSSSKRRLVRFDDNVAVLSPPENGPEDALTIEDGDEGDDVDFVISIGEDGDWDYTINTEEKGDPPAGGLGEAHPSRCKKARSGSPHAEPDSRLCEELYMMCPPTKDGSEKEDQPPLSGENSNDSLGNNLKISIKAFNDAQDRDGTTDFSAAIPIPLITPPSSPRRIRTFSCDGVTTEEATICEWPCNLAVDNAITAALESASFLSLPDRNSIGRSSLDAN